MKTDYLRLLFTWKVQSASLSSMKQADAIYAFSFGLGPYNTPGAINKALASAAKHLYANVKLPLYAQWEIAEELKEQEIPVTFAAYPTKGYLNTKDVLEQFRKKNPHMKNVIIIAHPDHQFRCGALVKTAGLTPLFLDIKAYLPQNSWLSFGCDKNGYWKHSTQDWTTSRSKFIRYEIAVRYKAHKQGLII